MRSWSALVLGRRFRVAVGGMRRWRGAISALTAIGLAIAVIQVAPWPRFPDYPPFVMTMEIWNAARIGYSDGRMIGGTSVYRLEYHRRDEWTLILVSDDLGQLPGQGNACRNGTYGYIDIHGGFHGSNRDDLGLCNEVGRWIHAGLAECYPWKREIQDGRVIYTDPGERVVFDRATGLPLEYKAGIGRVPVGERIVYRVERWLSR